VKEKVDSLHFLG